MKRAIVFSLFLALPLASCNAAEPRNVATTLDRSELVAREKPLITGVGVHFGIGGERGYIVDKSVSALDELGVDSFRDDVTWNSFNPQGKGHEVNRPAKLYDLLRKTKQKPLLIFGQRNRFVAGGDPPVTDEGRENFAKYVVDAMRVTAPFDPIYEIWNEWNLSVLRLPDRLKGPGQPDDPRAAVNYASLARAAVLAARQERPATTTLYGAMGEDADWSWTKAMVDAAGLAPDAPLSVHLYNHCQPLSQRTATEIGDNLNKLQTILGRQADPQAIYMTEFGWPTAAQHKCGIPLQVAADNIAQFLLWSAGTPWMKGAWVYELKDSGLDAADLEHNFGLYDYNYNPKPAACSVRETVQLIKSSKSFALKRLTSDLFVLQMDSAKGVRFVAWRSAGHGSMKLSLGDAKVTARTICGGTLSADRGGLDVGSTPVVVEVAERTRAELAFSVP